MIYLDITQPKDFAYTLKDMNASTLNKTIVPNKPYKQLSTPQSKLY